MNADRCLKAVINLLFDQQICNCFTPYIHIYNDIQFIEQRRKKHIGGGAFPALAHHSPSVDGGALRGVGLALTVLVLDRALIGRPHQKA